MGRIRSVAGFLLLSLFLGLWAKPAFSQPDLDVTVEPYALSLEIARLPKAMVGIQGAWSVLACNQQSGRTLTFRGPTKIEFTGDQKSMIDLSVEDPSTLTIDPEEIRNCYVVLLFSVPYAGLRDGASFIPAVPQPMDCELLLYGSRDRMKKFEIEQFAEQPIAKAIERKFGKRRRVLFFGYNPHQSPACQITVQ